MRILTIALMSLLSACSIRFPQVENIVHALQDKPPEVENYRWQLKADGYSQSVLAVTAENGLVFANTADDAMLFDGEALRRVVKLGNNKNRYEIVDINQGERLLRQYLVNGARQADHVCSAWVKNAVEWLQTCHEPVASQNSYVNRLGFNAEGKLNYIDQVISADNIRVTISQ